MRSLLEDNPLILMEAAVVERLRREFDVPLHPVLVHGLFIYDERGSRALTAIFEEYIEIAKKANLSLILCTPTWRANRERLEESNVEQDVNGDAVRFVRSIRSAQGEFGSRIRVGGLIGCKNDCYRPEEGLSSADAEAFHGWQIGALARAGVDFLMASTLPSVEETIGIASAMAVTDVPYVISFVIDRTGRVLDGTSLTEATHTIDAAVKRRPIGFMVNCAHPTFLRPERQPPELFQRLIGYQGNASSLDHCDLDGASSREADPVPDWGNRMVRLHRDFGVRILGGCCGTGAEHLREIAGSSEEDLTR